MDPIPLKTEGEILAKIRDLVQPHLDAAGFIYASRNKPAEPPLYLYIDYVRGGDTLRLSWDRRDSNQFIGLVAELIREPDQIITIAKADVAQFGLGDASKGNLARAQKLTAGLNALIE